MVYRLSCIRLLLFIALGSTSCDQVTNWFCGELGEFEKQSIDSVEKLHVSYIKVETIPCEYLYVNLHLKTEYVDTLRIGQIHKILFNEETKEGWQSMNIYDAHDQYLFSHHYNGKINVKKSGK